MVLIYQLGGTQPVDKDKAMLVGGKEQTSKEIGLLVGQNSSSTNSSTDTTTSTTTGTTIPVNTSTPTDTQTSKVKYTPKSPIEEKYDPSHRQPVAAEKGGWLNKL